MAGCDSRRLFDDRVDQGRSRRTIAVTGESGEELDVAVSSAYR
jgi:hypothetical protein